jgi:hypothetical protein
VTDLVVIVLGPIGTLELPADVYEQYLRRHEPPRLAADKEPLLTSAQLAQALGIEQSWIETAGRRGAIPVVRCGRWVRYQRAAVVAALEQPITDHVRSGRSPINAIVNKRLRGPSNGTLTQRHSDATSRLGPQS